MINDQRHQHQRSWSSGLQTLEVLMGLLGETIRSLIYLGIAESGFEPGFKNPAGLLRFRE